MNRDTPSDPGTLGGTLGQQRVVMMAPGRAVIEYLVGQHMCHSGGIAQGGFVAGWIDAAMAHAIMAETGYDRIPMTLELKVSYFAPAMPGLVRAEAWAEQRGGSTWFMEGRLIDAADKVLAKASSTIRLIDAKRVAAKVAAG
ncbi:MAG: PaaI family thioesterase [Polymorphobacter sp.]